MILKGFSEFSFSEDDIKSNRLIPVPRIPKHSVLKLSTVKKRLILRYAAGKGRMIKEKFEENARQGISGFSDVKYGFNDEPVYRDALNVLDTEKDFRKVIPCSIC